MSTSPRALLRALNRLHCATPADVACLLDLPVPVVRAALLDLHRAGHVDRVLLPTGVLYAPRPARSDAA
jgi:hypothetical protein